MARSQTPPLSNPARNTVLSMAILVALFLSVPQESPGQQPPDSSNLWYAAGFKINQGKTYGTIGTILKVSGSLYNFTGTDLGGDEASAQTYFLLRLSTLDKFSLYSLAGPNVEKIYKSRADNDPINYLTAATGAVITFRASPTVRVWGMICYLFTDGDIRHWKYGAGITSPLSFGDSQK